MESANGLSLACSVPDCEYFTAAQPLPYILLELAFHTKVVHGVDVGNFPAILHSGPLPLLSYGGSKPLTNEKLIQTETLKVTATGNGAKS